MTPLPNAESIARVPGNMDHDEQPTSSMDENSRRDTTVDNSETDNSETNLNMYLESDRLRTFDGWPKLYIKTRDLAAAGFYRCDKTSDIVKCAYCGIKVGCWKRGDKPFSEHKNLSPRCRFVLENNENDLETPQDESSSSPGEDTCGPYGVGGSSSVVRTPADESEQLIGEYNISELPQFPQYSNYEERLKSFEDWHGKIPPDELSMAGFVYSKSGDRTRCFHCSGILYNWDEVDDPWTEHAHWYPRCKFVLKTRGQKFIDDARVRRGLKRTEDEMKKAIRRIKTMVFPNDANESSSPKNCKESSSEGSSNSDESSNIQDAAELSSCRETRMCLICMNEERNTVLLPCYHVVACAKCVNKLTNCCVCREKIIYQRRIYIP